MKTACSLNVEILCFSQVYFSFKACVSLTGYVQMILRDEKKNG